MVTKATFGLSWPVLSFVEGSKAFPAFLPFEPRASPPESGLPLSTVADIGFTRQTAVMSQTISWRWIGIGLAALCGLGVWGLTLMGANKARAQVSYHMKLAPIQSVEFKSELRRFALHNGYDFIDGSADTNEAREYINRKANAGLAVAIIDVTLEPKDSNLGLFAFAKTAAYNEQDLTLTIVYNEGSPVERSMAGDLSEFALKWTRLPMVPST